MNKYTVLTAITLSLVGCGAEEPIKDEAFYKTHDVERMAKIEWCKESIENKLAINCINAISAQAQIDIEIMLGEGVPRS